MSVTLPDLRTPDPTRTDINEDTIAFDDLTETLVAMTRCLARFEDTLESRHGTATIVEIDELSRRLGYFKKRMANERKALNKAFDALPSTKFKRRRVSVQQ